MEAKMSLLLVIFGVAFLVVGGIMILSAGKASSGYTTTTAEIVKSFFSDVPNKIELIVRFEADGKIYQQRTQPVRTDLVNAGVGDRIEISYRRTRHAGISAWSIYVGSDAQAGSKAAMIRIVAGVAGIVGGILLLIVSFQLKKWQ